MVPDNTIELERELAVAMTEEVAGLATPRVDLDRIRRRRRRAMRRRLLVPAVVALVGLLATGPLTLARGGIQLGRSERSEPAGQPTPPAQLEGSGNPGQPVRDGDPPAGVGTQPADQPAQPGQGGGQAPADGCASLRGPLPATVRAQLAHDAAAALEGAEREVAVALGTVERLGFAAHSADRLLPAAGSALRLVECAGGVRLAPAERAAILGQVRAVVVAAAVVNGGVLEETVGKLDLGAAVATPVAVTVTSRTEQSVVLTSSLGGGAVAHLGTVVTTVRLSDSRVTRVDLRGLDLGGLGVGALGLLPGLNLLEGLAALEATAGVQALVPSPSAVVAADVETVLP
jgi:hypothetical protein